MSDEARSNQGSTSAERRTSQRIPVEMWVEESTDRELYFQRGANLSLGGIFLERTIPHPRGTLVNLRFTLPTATQPICVRGEIVNVGDAANELGMGIRFIDLPETEAQRIAEFIERATQKTS